MNKSSRICSKCGDYHRVKDVRPYEGAIRRTLQCTQCYNLEYSIEIRVLKTKPLTKISLELQESLEA